MPYIEQYTNLGTSTTNTYFFVSDGNTYYKFKQSDMYNEILTLAGSINFALGDLTNVDTTTTPPVTNDFLRYDGTDWVPMNYPVIAKSTNYTATISDEVITVDASGGSKTITLPTAASCENKRFIIIKTDSSGNSVTVDGDGSETINGTTTVNTSTQWAWIEVISNGTYWLKR